MPVLRIFIAAAGVAVLGFGAYSATRRTEGPVPPILAPLFSRPHTLVDVTADVDDLNTRYYPFTLTGRSTVTVELEVVAGRGITSFVFPEGEKTRFERAQDRIFLSSFDHIRALKADNRLYHQATTDLDEGRYLLAVNEGSARNVIGERDTATVRILVTAE